MIVYLDQNKWIELAKIIHGKNSSPGAQSFIKEVRAAVQSGLILPLSAIHYLEFASISNPGRRERLGEVMWDLSQGKTLVSYRDIVRRELEIGLSTVFPKIKPRQINLIGKGIVHAFGKHFDYLLPEVLDELFEKAIFTGLPGLGVEPIKHPQTGQRGVFLSHLNSLHEKSGLLEKGMLDNWLHAMAIIDIKDPLIEILNSHKISQAEFENLTADDYKKILAAMPTRQLDMHLHRQVIKNKMYKAKPSDLEDWAGVGVASCYCDVVICEKHFADMLRRDKYSPRARIETDLYKMFTLLE
ncbi:hypothetical protein ACOAPY_01975 [Pseudomonas sp. P3C3]